jgi:polyhydroxybutyrate depolymerase
VNGFVEDAVFGFSEIVDEAGFLYALPDGTKDSKGNRFWNATDACCNFDGSTVDDVAYLDAVIDDMSAHYHVDPKRVFVVGHSNGGYMAHRYACDRAGRVAAILSLAGHNWKDPAKCNPSMPVSVVQVHGTADSSTPYQGGSEEPGLPPAPSAIESVTTWATKDGCATPPVDAAPIDLLVDGAFPGAETTVQRFPGCPAGVSVELWSMQGANHVPPFKSDFPTIAWTWLAAHARD